MPSERVFIFLDGNNFYNRLKELTPKGTKLPEFDYDGFADFLARKRTVVGKGYYVGAVRAKPTDRKAVGMMADQHRLVTRLKKEGWKIEFGYLLQYDDGKFHEKGVDVKIAVDMLVGAYGDQYDTALLVSSDTDLIPALDAVRSQRKNVEYIGFGNRPSYGLQRHASLSRLLVLDDLKQPLP